VSDSPTSTNRKGSRSGVRLKGPAVAGLCAISLIGCAAAAVSYRPPPMAGYHLTEAKLSAARVQTIVHSGGKIAAVHAEAGRSVAAGDLLATIEAGDLDNRIAALKAQSEAAQLQLQAVRREAQAFSTLLEQRLVSRQRVVELERQVADLEKETAAVLSRTAAAEAELSNTEIRAPVGGVLRSAGKLEAGRTIEPGELIAEIAPREDVIVLETLLPPALAKAAQSSGRARVWLGTASWLDARPLEAKLTWLAPLGSDAEPVVAHFELPKSSLAGPAAKMAPFQRVILSIRTVEKSLLQTLLEPFRRGAGSGSTA